MLREKLTDIMLGSSNFDEQPTWKTPFARLLEVARRWAKSASQDSYAPLFHNLIKSSGLYALASLVGPLISLVLAPFLTHSLSRADYGALTVLNTAIALVAGLTQCGLGSAFFRAFNYDYESERDKLDVLSTTIVLLSL